jgi:TatD DNase family protein
MINNSLSVATVSGDCSKDAYLHMVWIDSHCHLDAAEFDSDRAAVREQARLNGVKLCIWPAVDRASFARISRLASTHNDAYALGIHPLFTPQAESADLQSLHQELSKNELRCVAVGEIGLDAFVNDIAIGQAWEKQQFFYESQLELAQQHELPVILHVRKSADQLLKGLRQKNILGGIAHAFNGSLQQAKAFINLGFKLGFGGAITYDRAHHLRELVQQLPLESIVLETDSPDMPPSWLYVSAQDRAQGKPQGRNSPSEIPRIAEIIAQLRGITPTELAVANKNNTLEAIPRLQLLLS